MRRVAGQPRLLALCRNYVVQKSVFGKSPISSSTLRTLTFIISVVGLLGLAYTKLSTVNIAQEGVRSKYNYKSMVGFDGYNDTAFRQSGDKINEIGSGERRRQSIDWRLLTEDLLRQKSSTGDPKGLHRIRRDRYSEIEQYIEYRQHRSADQSDPGLPTITVVHNNRIQGEIEETATKRDRKISERSPTPKHGKENLEKSQDSEQNFAEMDVIYMHTLDACEALLETNHTNGTSDDNATASHADGHGDRCAKEVASGLAALWVFLYITLILFLFIGLAIICDDFFIDSLSAISERLNLSEDVAGATFMAAGSSAPELFISVAGAGAGSDVGVGTIVGSAVFNLLIIVALTAALAGQILSLDWRPFVRDSVFYSLSIVAFILFSLDAKFQFWESLLLLALYALYILVMKFNPQIMDWMAKWSRSSCFESRVAPEVEPSQPDPGKKANVVPVVANVNPPVAANLPTVASSKIVPAPSSSPKVSKVAVAPRTPSPAKKVAAPEKKPSALTEKAAPKELPKPRPSSSPPPARCLPAGSKVNGAKSTKLSPPAKKNGNEGRGFCTCGSGCAAPRPQTCTCCVIHITSQPCVFCTTHRSLPASGIRCSSCSSTKEEPMVFSEKSQGENNDASEKVGVVDERDSCNVALNGECSASAPTLDSAGDVRITSKRVWFRENDSGCSNGRGKPNGNVATLSEKFAEKACRDVEAPAPEQGQKDEDEGAEPEIVILPCLPPIINSPPDKPGSSSCLPALKYVVIYCVYLLSFPWVLAFTWTIPKCNTPQKRKWYLLSFIVCILWIALVSWVMIVLVEKIGCLLNIDTYTMGLIVVAVGTSVPDAISSVLVAKEGHGDMAVSNALGSNVFDINLGLGLPFFLGSIVTGKPINLMSPLQTCVYETLPISLKLVPHVKFGIILLAVLLVAVAVFMFVKFRLNMKVTILFVAMYVAFMIYALVQEKRCHTFFC